MAYSFVVFYLSESRSLVRLPFAPREPPLGSVSIYLGLMRDRIVRKSHRRATKLHYIFNSCLCYVLLG
jgi:hypothetical protein